MTPALIIRSREKFWETPSEKRSRRETSTGTKGGVDSCEKRGIVSSSTSEDERERRRQVWDRNIVTEEMFQTHPSHTIGENLWMFLPQCHARNLPVLFELFVFTEVQIGTKPSSHDTTGRSGARVACIATGMLFSELKHEAGTREAWLSVLARRSDHEQEKAMKPFFFSFGRTLL